LVIPVTTIAVDLYGVPLVRDPGTTFGGKARMAANSPAWIMLTNTAGIGSRDGSWNSRIRSWVQTVYMPRGKTAAQ
jgi:hypothetical protein